MPDDTASVFEFMFPTEVWEPVSKLFSSSMSLASFILFWFVILTIGATYVDVTKEIPGAWNPWAIFWFVALNVLLVLLIAWWFSPVELPYIGEVLSSAPNTCVGEYGSLEVGMCYKNCEPGYHGRLTTCYADTFGRGIGIPVGLAHKDATPGSWCPKDWTDDGALCRAPLGWNDRCVNWGLLGWSGCATGGQVEAKQSICPGPGDFGSDYKGEYWKWRASNGKGDPVPGETLVQANAANNKTCADLDRLNDKHSDLVGMLCYKPCPKDYPEKYPGAPYMCYKGGRTSYDRGPGRAPPAFRLLKKYAVNIPPTPQIDNRPI
jgi:hypothetical protein